MGSAEHAVVPGRLVGLELLRILAAIAVLVWHYQHFKVGGHIAVAWIDSRMPLRWLLAPFYDYGYSGVQMFWCISGFIFTWKYGASIARSDLSFPRFAMLRLTRLYPLHFITLLIVVPLQWIYVGRNGVPFIYSQNDLTHFVSNLLFTNWWNFESDQSFNGPSWSVAAEVFIYCVFFCAARGLGFGWRVDIMMLMWFVAAESQVPVLSDRPLAVIVAGRFFYLGALTCHAYQWIETVRPGLRRPVACGCAGLLALYVASIAARMVDFTYAIQIMFPTTVLLAQLAVRPRGARGNAVLTGLGNLTYASYMLHFPMQLTAMLIIGGLAIPVQTLVYSNWFMLSYLGLVLVSAFVVFHTVERPAQSWLRSLALRRAARRRLVPASGL